MGVRERGCWCACLLSSPSADQRLLCRVARAPSSCRVMWVSLGASEHARDSAPRRCAATSEAALFSWLSVSRRPRRVVREEETEGPDHDLNPPSFTCPTSTHVHVETISLGRARDLTCPCTCRPISADRPRQASSWQGACSF